MDISDFQKQIGYFFKNPELLIRAFTHTSYANEHNTKSYERMEFLGDAIVDFLVGTSNLIRKEGILYLDELIQNYFQTTISLMEQIILY